MSVKIIQCSCSHEEQDKLYGKNKRVGNELATKKADSSKAYRCTVCNKESK